MSGREAIYPHNPVLRGIAPSRRRGIIRILLDWDSLIAERNLVTRLTATEQGTSNPDGTAAEAKMIRIELVHRDLPALETAGLIEWDRDDETVRLTTHPALDDPRFKQLLEIESEDLDAVLSGLSHEYRRIALTVLKEAETSVTRTDLARNIVRREIELTECDHSTAEEVSASMYHSHLPKLAEMDLIEYDSDTDRATHTTHPVLEEVFTIIFEPDETTACQLDKFLDGLQISSGQETPNTGQGCKWPQFWLHPYHE